VSAASSGVAPEASFIVLHDQGDRGPRVLQIGEREWALIEGMDGTRDVEGLARNARSRGTPLALEHAHAFVSQLASEGLLTDEAEAKPPSGPQKAESAEPTTRSPRPLEHLPGFRLRCDGRGSCCRLYPTIVFSPLDAARARAALPLVRDGGHDEGRVFLPEHGSRREALAVTLVDGRCAYLGHDGLCGIHAALGPNAKPFGCQSFPVSLVDDGLAVRVTPGVECACVVRSAVDGGTGGEPLVDSNLLDSAALDPRLYVDVLPLEIQLSASTSVARASFVDWSRAICETPVANAVGAFSSLASHVAGGTLSVDLGRAAMSQTVTERPERLLPFVRALGARARVRARETWRSESDLARQVFVALEAAAALAEDAFDALASPSKATHAAEAFYVRATLFGHHLVARSHRMPLEIALLDRATRIVMGRALAVVVEMTALSDPAFEEPLALVEATLRGHGLAAYWLDVARGDTPLPQVREPRGLS
jgi:lysine-N-methylase